MFALTTVALAAALPAGVITMAGAGRMVALLNVARCGTPFQLAVCLAVALLQTAVAVEREREVLTAIATGLSNARSRTGSPSPRPPSSPTSAAS